MLIIIKIIFFTITFTVGNFFRRLDCKLFGHDLRFNFPSLPTKCICYNCNAKFLVNYKTFPSQYEKVEKFEGLGTDEQIKKRWKDNKS